MSNIPDTTRSSADNKKQLRIIIYIVIAVLAVIAIIALIFIISGSTGSGTVIHTEGTRHDVTVAADGGPDGGELAGLWQLDEVTSYEFDGTGRGIVHTANDFPFSYSAENGVLSIDIDTDDARDTNYQYVLDGYTLTLTRGDAEYVFTKQP